MAVFWRQFAALVWKNWIVLAKHPFLNILRCFISPVAFGIFLAFAEGFLGTTNNLGIGEPIPVPNLRDEFDGSLALIWADATTGTGTPLPSDIMGHITSGFSTSQLRAIHQVVTPNDVPTACPQNFNQRSECFAAIIFTNVDGNATNPVQYTIRADGGLSHIDVIRHKGDFERRVLPLQWAVDQAIIALTTGSNTPTPQEWPFTQETNEEQETQTRKSYIIGIRTLLVLALFLCYIGIAYQLPGELTAERANHLTPHMKSMGLLDSARVISWHVSMSLAYLPAWIVVAVIWQIRIFKGTDVGLLIGIHLLFGLSLASWSFFTAAPFGKSPSLAAVSTTFLALVFAVCALIFIRTNFIIAFVFIIVFPPSYYIFAIRVICGFESAGIPATLMRNDPEGGQISLLALMVAAIINIFLWPWLAVILERRLYDARESSTGSWLCCGRRKKHHPNPLAPDVAISVQNLGKTFSTDFFGRKKGLVTAISDLTLNIPKFGIFVLLGPNGAGKSTALSILGGLTGRSRGDVVFEGNVSKPPRGILGIVPQKNVLFPELSCYQTVKLWRAIKHSTHSPPDEDIEQLLRDCDLDTKIHAKASTLSGGQKRKLQLAIGLVGGSKIVLVDEVCKPACGNLLRTHCGHWLINAQKCTSGADPLSRRALWRTLTSFRGERTIVFTTHFLDEADLLADHIAILASPGKLVAEGTPVSLKRDLGKGYTVQVSFDMPESSEKGWSGPPETLSAQIRALAPSTHVSSTGPGQASYHLKTRDALTVERVLQLLADEKARLGITSSDVLGTQIEDIFLDLMHKHEAPARVDAIELDKLSKVPSTPSIASVDPPFALTQGRTTSPLQQARTIFWKRVLIARRSFLAPILAVVVAVCGSTIPLVFLTDRPLTCIKSTRIALSTSLYLPSSPIVPFYADDESSVLAFPPGIVQTLGSTTAKLGVADVTDNAIFVDSIQSNYMNLSIGGISLDLSTKNALIAYEASSPGLTGPTLLNFVSNILYNRALNATGAATNTPTLIQATYEAFPPVDAGTLDGLKWVVFFGATMAVFPALFSLYVSRERRSSVQAMQLSNGLSNPVGLWLGHLLFDSIFCVILATVIIILLAKESHQFYGLGLFWLVLVLYGIAGTLFSYCLSLVTASPLAAFATVAGYQILIYILYIAGYLLTITYAKTSQADHIITIIHFTLSLLAPVASVLRAGMVSINLFSLLCDGNSPVTTASTSTIMHYGGPILYLVLYAIVLFIVLVRADSGTLLPRSAWSRRNHAVRSGATPAHEDVQTEAKSASTSHDLLRVLNVTKSYGGNKVVDDVSLGVARDTVFALLGPNGAGKTTTFNLIRGDVLPDAGDILLDGMSVVQHPRTARLALGVCPQFTAIDSQLTVREHLTIYGRLKGLGAGSALRSDITALLHATALDQYADRLASKLSGGNQRKLALAIALIGNPSVVLIDEFSTGIDAKTKRDMWNTLRKVSAGKALVITTHSMEEASALANKVGIIAKRMLAVGTTDALSARYATYEVHFSCRSREDVTRAQQLMAQVPGSRMADDVATRFEVPVDGAQAVSLAQLFHILSSQGDFAEYTVEKATLESVFLKVIRENNVVEEDSRRSRRRWWSWA